VKDLLTTTVCELVVRSEVPKGLAYAEYRQHLRFDFFYSCAYCTMGETEAMATHFCIDHYEPQRSQPDLVNEYENLMYSCNGCNVKKGSRSPTAEEQAKGFRFFRPDQDVYKDHFERSGRLLKDKTPVGYYTIEGVDLNRLQLRRLRELRERLRTCDEYVFGGIMALRKFPLDRLPQHLKGQALTSINHAMKLRDDYVGKIDTLLRENAKSPLLDEDPEAEKRAKERKVRLKQLDALEPERWAARR
jgi:HNH endonuclease